MCCMDIMDATKTPVKTIGTVPLTTGFLIKTGV